MKRKKLLSLILALAMAFSLALPAFAGEGDEPAGNEAPDTTSNTTQTVQMNAGIKSGVINFTMASPGAVILNPYQMKASAGSDSTGTYHQIYSPAVYCKNKSTFPLSIEATVTGKPSPAKEATDETPAVVASTAKIVAAAPAATVTEKQVFLYAEFGVSDAADKEPVWATAYNKSATNQVVASETGANKKGVASLPATDGEEANANYLWFKFDGAATKTPSEAWLASDTVDATVALTLHSVVSDVYSINVTNTTTATAKGTATLNYDVAPAGESITLTVESDANVASKATVTVKAGSTNITCTGTGKDASDGCGTYIFDMPAGAVTITVKWAAA